MWPANILAKELEKLNGAEAFTTDKNFVFGFVVSFLHEIVCFCVLFQPF